MTALTWIAVAVLGIGSVGVFVFFLLDLSKVLPTRLDDDDTGSDRRRRM